MDIMSFTHSVVYEFSELVNKAGATVSKPKAT